MAQFIFRLIGIILMTAFCVMGIISFALEGSWYIVMPITVLLEVAALVILTVVDFRLYLKERKEEKLE